MVKLKITYENTVEITVYDHTVDTAMNMSDSDFTALQKRALNGVGITDASITDTIIYE